MAYIFMRHHKYSARLRVPAGAEHLHNGNSIVERSLGTGDRLVARAKAAAWEAELRGTWAVALGRPEKRTYRDAYLQTRQNALAGEYRVLADGADPIALGIDHEIEKIAERVGEASIAPSDAARLAGLGDALAEYQGQPAAVPREYEAPFSAVSAEFMAHWKRQQGLKETNTEQQKRATLRLFEGFWKDRPLRGITERDATEFADIVRALNPAWARSASSRELPWATLVQISGNHRTGLSASTMNRHMAALATFWHWARKRGHCSGDNPFEGHHQRLTATNTSGYLAWEPDELKRLLSPPPARSDLAEIIRVALFTGMRLNEIASLTWGQVRTDEGVTYFQIDDAKTPAGVRQVPVHPALGWLVARREGKDVAARLWPTFNPEGPGAKPGADAGREFSRFKASRGFTQRRKAFHSFRKNVTRIMERAGVPENEWAQIFGHERGFTYSVYNPDGITLARKAEIIGLIDYKGAVDLAEPAQRAAPNAA